MTGGSCKKQLQKVCFFIRQFSRLKHKTVNKNSKSRKKPKKANHHYLYFHFSQIACKHAKYQVGSVEVILCIQSKKISCLWLFDTSFIKGVDKRKKTF